jgi:heat shock protein HslJ
MSLLLVGWLVFLTALVPVEQRGGAMTPSSRLEQRIPMPLVGPYWRLRSVGDLTVPEESGTRVPHIIFTADGSVTGSDGCNTLRATVTADDDALKIGGLMGTLITCAIPDKLDRRMREALVVARSWKVAGNRLTLADDKGTTVATFEGSPVP